MATAKKKAAPKKSAPKAKTAKPRAAHLAVVLDRSGSMESVRADTIGGFNQMLADQKKAPGTASFLLARFDHEYEIEEHADIANMKSLDMTTFVPRGMTALYDAIGRTINATEKHAKAGKKIIIVIQTDGHENASREFTGDKVREMIGAKRKDGWEFLFLGANIDAMAAGSKLNISASNTMSYASNSVGTTSAFASTSNVLLRGRSGASGQSMGYTDEDRDAQKKAGA